jgi:curved DNA-binding protein CbpA
VAQAAAASAALSAALAPAALKTLLASLLDKQTDHFTVLGVKRDTPPAQVKVAYFQLAKVYHPDTVPVSAPPEVKQLCADVFARIGEAWSILGDEARRARYAEDLRTGAGVDVDVMNIFQAENAFQAGTLLVKARRYDEAIVRFDEAMKLNPDEAEFGMWRAWCEFLLAPDKKRVHPGAAGLIEAGLKKNPRCAQGYLFLGQMAKLLGDLALAERQLKRGLAVAPEHSDLVRELKYLRK